MRRAGLERRRVELRAGYAFGVLGDPFTATPEAVLDRAGAAGVPPALAARARRGAEGVRPLAGWEAARARKRPPPPRNTRLTGAAEVVEATLRHDLLNAQSRYVSDGFTVTVEYPVNLINLNEEDTEFQVCTGPVLLPDLATWDGRQPARVFLAHAAFSAFDHVEFILRRQVEAAPEERRWLDRPRGRDRFELIDPSVAPPGHPLRRPRPYAFNETWELAAENAILAAANDAPRR